MPLSIAEREHLYEVAKTVFADDLHWQAVQPVRPDLARWRLRTAVFGPGGEFLSLRGSWTAGGRYSFALLHRDAELIRRWDYGGHTGPDDTHFEPGEGHKHPRGDRLEHDWAYRVSDIPTNDVGEALARFLKECNITINDRQQSRLPLLEPRKDEA